MAAAVSLERLHGMWQDIQEPCPLDKYDLHARLIDDYREFAATTIQRLYRGHVVRAKLRRQRMLEEGQRERLRQAALLQQAQRPLDDAARRIQRAWAARNDRRTFRHLCEMIRSRERGDPRALLRCINPLEAALADAAAGVHVRFRLGGSTFPPHILFKVFTHRPITDICAFCPRDYAHEAAAAQAVAAGADARSRQRARGAKSPPAHAQPEEAGCETEEEFRAFTPTDGRTAYRSTRGWYRRVENNGWRPLSDALLLSESRAIAARGHVTDSSTKRAAPVFHHVRLVRREDVARRRKQRRRQWLQRLYQLASSGDVAGQSSSGVVDSTDAGDSSCSSQRSCWKQGNLSDSVASAPCNEVLGQQESSTRRSSNIAGASSGEGGRGCSVDGWLDAAVEQAEGNDALMSAGPTPPVPADDLLRWAALLDYDSYVADWRVIAVTAGSETLVPLSDAALLEALCLA